MTYTMPHRFEVSLVVNSDAVASAELWKILGLPPDEHWEKGSLFVMAGKERRHRFNRWSIAESVGDLAEMNGAIERLIQRLTPIRDRFGGLPAGTRIGFTVIVTTPQDVLGIGLTAEQVAFLASIGADVDLSIVVLVPPPPGEST